jgi:hypothetical protein
MAVATRDHSSDEHFLPVATVTTEKCYSFVGPETDEFEVLFIGFSRAPTNIRGHPV